MLQKIAGGFDAIFCIVLSDKSRNGVENVWSNFKEMSVGPLLCTESIDGGLVVELYQDAEPSSDRNNFTVVKRLVDL